MVRAAEVRQKKRIMSVFNLCVIVAWVVLWAFVVYEIVRSG